MIYNITIPPFIKSLSNLSLMLDKAAAHADTKKFDVDVLLNSRLFPDQFNLIRQVQIACDTAKIGTSRLTGKEAPKHEDSEKTLPELKKRIEETVQFLKTFTPEDFKEAATRHISQPRWKGKYLTGEEFCLEHAIPNVYFHVTTAYSILRHNGVEVGKKDYLGALPFKE